mmetsp:Transcript_7835/g.16826  ORF Transcript_7835/g.16826 Transcript_7835/m.16826 type:complete len:83 (+) Transcript_7835:513-761(+)
MYAAVMSLVQGVTSLPGLPWCFVICSTHASAPRTCARTRAHTHTHTHTEVRLGVGAGLAEEGTQPVLPNIVITRQSRGAVTT